MQKVHQENPIETQKASWNPQDEMSGGEMFHTILNDFRQNRGRTAFCIFIVLSFFCLTLLFWVSFGWNFYRQGPGNEYSNAYGLAGNQISRKQIRIVHRTANGEPSTQVPPWIHENLTEKLFSRLQDLDEGLSIYDESLITQVQNALKEIYWILEVKKIQKFYPAFLEIEVTYRKPTLLVVVRKEDEFQQNLTSHSPVSGDSASQGADSSNSETGQRNSPESDEKNLCYVPLSQDCRILPTAPEKFPVRMEDLERFPVFCGEAPQKFYDSDDILDIYDFAGYGMPPQKMPGAPWDRDSFIREAVELVNLLGKRWEKWQIDYLCLEKRRINDYDYGFQFCFVTRNGSKIHWGRSISQRDEYFLKDDILNSEKLAKLDQIYEKKGFFDRPGESFDLTFRHPMLHEKQTQIFDSANQPASLIEAN